MILYHSAALNAGDTQNLFQKRDGFTIFSNGGYHSGHMNISRGPLVAVLAIIVLAAVAFLYWSNTGQPSTTDPGTGTGTPMVAPALRDDSLVVDTPLPNAIVSSPLTISGRARGEWYFEASFPVKIVDAKGKQLGIVQAQAQGEWMTTDYVPFTTQLPFSIPSTPTGTLILEKDNPSGLPEHANQLDIPIRFTAYDEIGQHNGDMQNGTSIQLYYYNASLDNSACSSAGLVAVDRVIPKTSTPLKDSIELLLKGELSAIEKAQGISSDFPLPGVSLKSATLSNGTATLTFGDPQNKTSGGSCRVSVLWAQIEATAKQFPTVKSVTFAPAELFQP